jgi:hypothetical protein
VDERVSDRELLSAREKVGVLALALALRFVERATAGRAAAEAGGSSDGLREESPMFFAAARGT